MTTTFARPSEDQNTMDIAVVVSRRATCSRLKVGAVLVRDGRILSAGRNGAPAGLEHCAHTTNEPCQVSVHAEANAINFAARHGVAVYGATMFCTHAPCVTCSGSIINAGVSEVVYLETYRSTAGLTQLDRAGVKVRRLDLTAPWHATEAGEAALAKWELELLAQHDNTHKPRVRRVPVPEEYYGPEVWEAECSCARYLTTSWYDAVTWSLAHTEYHAARPPYIAGRTEVWYRRQIATTSFIGWSR